VKVCLIGVRSGWAADQVPLEEYQAGTTALCRHEQMTTTAGPFGVAACPDAGRARQLTCGH
jgi:hypothetical protein